MALRLHTLDVFTERRFGGNPLAVVHDADALDGKQMQTIARELNLSETVFLLKPENPAHSAKVRIFTPGRELPFAGHPTIGTAILLAELRSARSSNGERDAIIVLEQAIGTVRVGVRLRAGQAPFAEFDAPKLPEKAGTLAARDRLADALGLLPREIGFENHTALRIAAGNTFAFVPVDRASRPSPRRASTRALWAGDLSAERDRRRLPLHAPVRAQRLRLPRAHVRPATRRARGPGDGVGGGRLCRRGARVRRAPRRRAQAGDRAGPRDGATELPSC